MENSILEKKNKWHNEEIFIKIEINHGLAVKIQIAAASQLERVSDLNKTWRKSFNKKFID
jgi:hypothetical protein